MPEFIPGLELAELFYRDAIRPILESRFPQVKYSAARIDFGSDVLGFDTPQSRDHGWGPRCMIFLREDDAASAAHVIRVLAEELPFEFLSYSTHFEEHDRLMRPTDRRPIDHGVEVTTVGRFFTDYIGFDPRRGVTTTDWLTTPAQKLRTIRSGRIFDDGLGELEAIRQRLHWYPRDIWLYLMASQWERINQEEPFVGRAGDVGDETGSRVIATRLIEDLVKLCLLMEREYPPYSKWLGTAFARLGCAGELLPTFRDALDAAEWKDREAFLSDAYLWAQRRHNVLAITPPIEETIGWFHGRPYRVPHSGRFVTALMSAIESESVKSLPLIGAVWQFSNSVAVLESVEACRSLGTVYNRGSA